MKRLSLTITLISLLLPIFSLATPTKVLSLQIQQKGSQTEIDSLLNHSSKYHCFMTRNARRFVVDLQNTVRDPNIIQGVKIKNTNVLGIRSGEENNRLRLSFLLKQPSNYQCRIQKVAHSVRDQLEIILSAKSTPKKKPVVKVVKKTVKSHIAVVVIDPGHGGKDPGATGLLGTHEKNVVLAIGKDLYALLKNQPNIHPMLTRSGDYFVPLRERLALAREAKADVFMAIHADAYKNRLSRGASVYALSQKGATSEAARWLAESENTSELMMGGIDLSDQDHTVRTVLLGLAQSATIRDSLIFGHYVVRALGKVARLHRNRVEQAPFVVLKSPDIPSLLVETGFISNRQEELKLRNPVYQHKIARALMEGIVRYLHRRAAYIAASKANMKYSYALKHKVQRGETLTTIAKQYHSSVAKIKKQNHLKSDQLKVGQVLRVSP